MWKGQARSVRWTAHGLTAIGLLLLVLGGLTGWLAPSLSTALPVGLDTFTAPLAQGHIDLSGYLGADITALAVIIAVVIGFNATTLQIAGQTHSLALVRVILLSMTPFLLCWCVTTAVALLYFILPPVYVGQAWQLLFWFAAVVIFMVAYLWELPWRLSGQYVASWAMRALSRLPLARWESQDAYSALQTAVVGASMRGDIGTVRAITSAVGQFLVRPHDASAEAQPGYDRSRYRALKNLLSGCVQHLGEAPNAVAYNLGYVLAGTILQAVATGFPFDDVDHNLFSGVLRAIHGAPERVNSLWTGVRHALFRGADHEPPYMLAFWRYHRKWPADDLRRASHVAEGLAALYAGLRQELHSASDYDGASDEAAQMLLDLYRYIAVSLAKRVAHDQPRSGKVHIRDLPLNLLDSVHAAIMRQGIPGTAESDRITVINTYEQYRAQLAAPGRWDDR